MLRMVSGDVIFPLRTCSYAFFKASSFADLACAAAGEAGVASGAFMITGATAGVDFNGGWGFQLPAGPPPPLLGGGFACGRGDVGAGGFLSLPPGGAPPLSTPLLSSC